MFAVLGSEFSKLSMKYSDFSCYKHNRNETFLNIVICFHQHPMVLVIAIVIFHVLYSPTKGFKWT